MTESSEHMQRMAVATFLDTDRLSRAIQELTADSVKRDQFCLIGTPGDLQGAMTSLPESASENGQSAVLDIGKLADGTPLAVVPAQFDRVDFGAELQPQGLLHGLETTLSRGAIALLVETRSVAQFAAATHVLLRYSSHRVRTREVSERSPDS